MHPTLICLTIWIFWFSLFEITYSYVIYPVLLRIFAWRFGNLPASSDIFEPTVAIVMPVFNEEKVIAGKLENLFALDYPPDKLSIWIGSDCSTDKTEAIISAVKNPRCHLWVAPKRSGKAGILNSLVPGIDADILVFTDADIMFDKDSIRALTRHFADESIGGVGGVTLPRSPEFGQTEELAYRNFETMQKRLESMLHSTISAFGSFYAIRKKLFIPFHPHTYSNDDVMMPMNIIRQGYRMFFESNAVSYEAQNPEVGIEFKRRIRIGAGNFQAFFWLLDFLNPLKGWPWFCYVSHKVTRWFSPLFLVTAVLSCGFLAIFNTAPLYKMLFFTGTIFAISSLFFKLIPLPIMRHIFYFLAMNVALGLGFFKFLGGIRSATWSRTERR
jgi:cellulose synthase/poly-beta-1,6-N-acetylglucosamine synthase-like glycosyltransferase